MNRIPSRGAQRGFSLIELMMVVGILGVLTAGALIQIGPARNNARGDAAMRIVLAQMNQARETAIAQRRYIRVTFDTTTNAVVIVREDTTAATTTLRTIGFEGGATFTLLSTLSATMPDTPDVFGKTTSTSFSSFNGTFASLNSSNLLGTNLVKFAPDGTLVDWNGRPANGSVFMAVAGLPTTARAVTILGSTGRVRGYRWNGSSWKVV
jgi:prepilin-type N-terminal cleavage/methylation domain-containing protein